MNLFDELEKLEIAKKVIERDKRIIQQYDDAKKIHKLQKIIATLVVATILILAIFVVKW